MHRARWVVCVVCSKRGQCSWVQPPRCTALNRSCTAARACALKEQHLLLASRLVGDGSGYYISSAKVQWYPARMTACSALLQERALTVKNAFSR
jgi:hypothetical protein